MNATKNCPGCNAQLPPDAPLGLCPACLFQQAADPQEQPGATEAASSAQPFQTPSPEALSKQFPHLEVLELLGRGGMGAVYKARQTMLDRLVALKILLPGLSEDPTFAERFVREAGALAKLSHPNLVTVHDFGETNGQYWLLMEYVDGENLRDAIRSGRLSPTDAIAVIPQICEALQYAHDEGVVHRDIKPENILLDRRGRVRIADFGLAKLLGRSPVEVTLTATHQVMGTLHYMAPEQMERPLEVDHRADIYSLGVVFYELLTGDLPLGRYKLPSEKKSMDARLDNVVMKTLEREPDERYQHASDVKMDIETIQQAELPIPPRARQAAAASRVVSLPMALSKQGMNFGHGVARFDGRQVTLEFEITSTWAAHPALAGFKEGVHEVAIELTDLNSIRLESGWLVNSLLLQATSMRSVADVPGAERGRVTLAIAKRDLPDAEEFARIVSDALEAASTELPGDNRSADNRSPLEPVLGATPFAAGYQGQTDKPSAESTGPASFVRHPGKLAMGLVIIALAGAMAAVSVNGNTPGSYIWIALGIFMAGGGTLASGVSTPLQPGWKLIGINWGAIILGLVLIAVGGTLFLASLFPHFGGDKGLLWVGLGLVMGGAGCLSGGWKASSSDHYYKLDEAAAAKFVIGGMLVLAGLGFLIAAWMHVGPHMGGQVWTGIGLILGGGGCWSGAWKKEDGVRPVSSSGWTSIASDRKPAKTMLSVSRQDVRHRLRIPATGLLAVGVMNCLTFVGLMTAAVVTSIDNSGGIGSMELMLIGGSSIIGFGLAVGGIQMFTRRNHTLAVLGAVLGVMPLTPFWFLSIAFGIWALMVLNRDDVKQEFDRVAAESQGW